MQFPHYPAWIAVINQRDSWIVMIAVLAAQVPVLIRFPILPRRLLPHLRVAVIAVFFVTLAAALGGLIK